MMWKKPYRRQRSPHPVMPDDPAATVSNMRRRWHAIALRTARYLCVATGGAVVLTPVATPVYAAGSAYEGQINGEFHGWDGETVYKLVDGHIIQQSEYDDQDISVVLK
jgi:hypothetical protein